MNIPKELIQPHINIYPNPVQDIFYIDMPLISSYQVSILEVQGGIVLTTKEALEGIDIRELPSAAYTLYIADHENKMIGSAQFFKR